MLWYGFSVFVLQAEDGIRDLVRSRGLGDVYKRQTVSYTAPVTPGTYTFTYTVNDNNSNPLTSNVATVTVTVTAPPITGVTFTTTPVSPRQVGTIVNFNATPVSYTHLTLPTISSV